MHRDALVCGSCQRPIGTPNALNTWRHRSVTDIPETCSQVQLQDCEGPQGKSSSAASDTAKLLMDEALRRGTADNVTVLVICINWE